ncbi:MAG TPA: hypothetical protein PLI11_05820 [Clostridia bacterium]|jgi:hypothetical protein|nr:hypothetical protein [Clostridiaceae bacterium]HOA30373.1 hypothetical protein [Clostridia bacterium]HPZ52415.1 hypothetical protein [Clostridia bacterium]
MSKTVSILLVLFLFVNMMPVAANADTSPEPEDNGDGKGFNWTLAFILSSIASFIIATIIAVKQANKRFPDEKS